MSKHTPGPWSAWRSTDGWSKVVDEQDITIADLPQQPLDEWKSFDNARLIAAAPEMFAQLERWAEWINGDYKETDVSFVEEQTLALIAEVTGK